ncbi:MAG TPA: nuclear transport factor 2 family protein [Verrucomicrobiae bacterium]|nr:nuclear transport factor 2 family protein [Verrucomicrobiae bacterium]
MSPTEIVQRQVEAYNARDLQAFAATYSETIQMIRLPATEPAIKNKAELVEFYGANRFMAPSLHAEILNRIVLGNKVIDHERITGLPNSPFECVIVYEVDNDLIQRVWSVWPK